MMIARTMLLDVVVHLRTRGVEWVFAAILASFAYRLAAPGETFSSSPSYAYMASWMSEQMWAYAIGTVAILRLLALTLNGTFRATRRWSPWVRAITAWLSCFVWGCLGAGFYISNPAATGWGTYTVIFTADICLAITIAHEAGHAVRTHRHAVSRSG